MKSLPHMQPHLSEYPVPLFRLEKKDCRDLLARQVAKIKKVVIGYKGFHGSTLTAHIEMEMKP